MKKAVLWVNLVVMGLLIFSGCSKKKDDPTPSASQKHMKMVITTTGLRADDYFSVDVIGSDVQTTTTTIYKVNGVTQPNSRSVTVEAAQFRAGKVTVETIVPLLITGVVLSGHAASGHTFSYKLEPEVDGKARTTITKTITSATYAESFQYTAGD
jgi:hypothetical protein